MTTQRTFMPQKFKGIVVKTAMQNTATVAVERYVRDSKYRKYHKRTKKYLVHNEDNRAQVGDVVMIVACRPLSKMKRFKISAETK